jgi:hypothetical protein
MFEAMPVEIVLIRTNSDELDRTRPTCQHEHTMEEYKSYDIHHQKHVFEQQIQLHFSSFHIFDIICVHSSAAKMSLAAELSAVTQNLEKRGAKEIVDSIHSSISEIHNSFDRS